MVSCKVMAGGGGEFGWKECERGNAWEGESVNGGLEGSVSGDVGERERA